MEKRILTIPTARRTQMIEITHHVQELVSNQKVTEGFCHLWVPHTTAAITVNENADPSVVSDMLETIDRLIPFEGGYRHSEGNSAAHIKSTLVGCEKTIMIESGRLQLGTWQGIYFCEFDGPRKRQVWLKIGGCVS